MSNPNPTSQSKVNCQHWRECPPDAPHTMGGDCAISVYHRPSFGTCQRCTRREPIPPELAAQAQPPVQPTIMGQAIYASRSVMRGAVGMVQAKLRIKQASKETIAARLAICATCEHSRPSDKPVESRRCGVLLDALRPGSAPCGCGLSGKTSQAGQACPVGRWRAEDPPSKAD